MSIPPKHPFAGLDEVQALAEAVLDAAGVAGLGIAVSFDGGSGPRLVYVNEPAAAILGYRAEELAGLATRSVLRVDARAEPLLEPAQPCGNQTTAPIETQLERRDGTLVPVELVSSAVSLAGEPALVLFLRDIRKRKRAEAALRQSEQRFRQLIEGAPDAIAVCRGGRFAFVNPAFTRLLSRPASAVIEHPVTDFVPLEDRESVGQIVAPKGEGGPVEGPLEHHLLLPGGQTVDIETRTIPIQHEGQPATLCFLRDITERKMGLARLAFRDRMATLGMLAAGVAHEINNPLGYATLNVEAIVRELHRCAPPGVVNESLPAVEAARSGLRRVGRIVRDLRSLSAPSGEPRWPVDLPEVAESALNVLEHMLQARARVQRDLRPVPPISTDPSRVGQILLNLLCNAAESFDRADLHRNVIVVSVQPKGESELSVSVSDNGPGIEPERLRRVFEPFFTTKGDGLGLGLAICQTLAAALGGRLEAISEPGAGSTFSLILPAPG